MMEGKKPYKQLHLMSLGLSRFIMWYFCVPTEGGKMKIEIVTLAVLYQD